MRITTDTGGIKLQFAMRLTLSMAILLATVYSIYLYIDTRQDKFKEALGFSATVMASSAAAITAISVEKEREHNAKSLLIDRTFSYVARWNNHDFKKQDIIALMREVRKLNEKEGRIHILEQLGDKAELMSELVCILNFLEEMSLAISNKVVDEDILKDFFRGIVKDFHEAFRPWLNERAIQKPDVYMRFRNLYDVWLGNKSTSPKKL